ncbi:MAG: zinc-ribbon domain-containing protein [Cystobacterineae bacterium]|nr:zinc-ribbon domain-containing protein [Cystobacterineae bacterium]
MQLICPSCFAKLGVAQDKISPQGAHILCPQCGQVFSAPPLSASSPTLPLAPAEESGASSVQASEASEASVASVASVGERPVYSTPTSLSSFVESGVSAVQAPSTLEGGEVQTLPEGFSAKHVESVEELPLDAPTVQLSFFKKPAPQTASMGAQGLAPSAQSSKHTLPGLGETYSEACPFEACATYSLAQKASAMEAASPSSPGVDTLHAVQEPSASAARPTERMRVTPKAPVPAPVAKAAALASPLVLKPSPVSVEKAKPKPKTKTSRLKTLGIVLGVGLLGLGVALYFVHPRLLLRAPQPMVAPVLPPLQSPGEMQAKLEEGSRQALSEVAAHFEVLSRGSVEQMLLWCRSLFSLALLGEKPEGLDKALALMERLLKEATHSAEFPKTKAALALLSPTPEEIAQAIEALAALPEADMESVWLLSMAYLKQGAFEKAVELLQHSPQMPEFRRQKTLGDIALAMEKPALAAEYYMKARVHPHPPWQAEMDLDIAKAWLEANRPEKALKQLSVWESAPLHESMAMRAWELLAHAQLELGLYPEAALTLEKLKGGSGLFAEYMAQLFVATGNPPRAAALLAEEVKKKPENLKLAKQYIQTLLLGSKAAEAESFARGLLEKEPENVGLWLFCAEVFQWLGQWEAALALTEKALVVEPHHVEAMLQWAALHQRLGQFLAAQSFLEKRLAKLSAAAKAPQQALEPLEAAALWGALGALFQETNNLPKAKEAYAQALLVQPNDLPALTGLGSIALAEGDLASLQSHVEKIQAFNPRSPEGAWLWSHLLWNEGNKEEALKKLEWALRKNGYRLEFWLSKAQMALEDKNLSAAGEALERARHLNPSLATVNHLSGLFFEMQGDFKKAQNHFQKAAEADKKNPLYALAQSRALMSMRHSQAAATLLKQLVAQHPHNIEAHLLLGRYYQERYRFRSALPLFEKALAMEPNNTEALRGAADCLLELTQWKQAIAMLQRLLQQSPDKLQTLVKLGNASFEAGHYAQAIRWYQKSLEQFHDNPSVLLNLGWAFKELGRKQEAIGAFKSYLQLEPLAPSKKMLEEEINFLRQQY